MNVTIYKTDEMARRYITLNGINGAFIYREGRGHYQVLEGNPDTQCGFVAGDFSTLREANKLCAAINARISSL